MHEIIVDSFAGGGGASTGIELALGRSPDIAVNHDATALAMHEVNHPSTVHITEDVWKVDPVAATGGRPVGLAWFSPDCKHFSKAKGGKPVNKNIRSLAWVVVHWANTVSPRVIILENVEEFQTWGPLGADNRPCPLQKGVTFKRWLGELKRLGYAVEWRELRACDYGAPTIRRRLFLIARRDGRPIVWPVPTHGDPKSDAVKQGLLKPWRTAAEIIDWSLPCPSIFDTAEEIFAKFGLRAVRPLQPATMARIAKGVKRYVLDAAKPFIVRTDMASGSPRNGVHTTEEPVRTMTSAQSFAVVQPFVTGVGGRMAQSEPRSADAPAQTLTAKADSVVVAPFGVPRYGERDGQEPRALSLETPAPVVVPTGNGASLVAPVLSAYYGKGEGEDGRAASAEEPLRTQTTERRHALIAPHLTKFRANSTGSGMDEPAPTVTANSFIKRAGGCAPLGVIAAHLAQHNSERSGEPKAGRPLDAPVATVMQSGSHASLVAAFMAQHNYLEPGHDAREPVSTVVGKGSTQGVVSAGLTILKGKKRRDRSIEDPAPAVLAEGNHTATTAAFIQKYYGTGEGQLVDDPLHSVTTKDRMGVVTVTIDGVTYVITDIGLRMLTPRELFRAQGFPESYIIDRKPDGSAISKTEQVSKCGNSVCPPMAAALVAANYRPDEVEPAPEFLEAAE